MKEYHDIVKEVLTEGNYKPNRTGIDTISKFGVSYTIDRPVEEFPLLTTKAMDGPRWNSLVHELLWYLTGEHHIRNLREKTGIWDAWANEGGMLETAYGRYWRSYPLPVAHEMHVGEPYESYGEGTGFDQIQWILDQLQDNPNSRRLVLTAWYPPNATVSKLPPCHFSSVFNVQNETELNLHLTQRSGDMAVGVPFNIASYALLQRIIAQEAGLDVGKFHHTIVDAHIYCGPGEREELYSWKQPGIRHRLSSQIENNDWKAAKGLFKGKSAFEEKDYSDHVPRLVEQLSREPLRLPEVEIADKPMDELQAHDFELKNYHRWNSLRFDVAE